jgi:cytoskeletal protein CcmA (bactofilin family)
MFKQKRHRDGAITTLVGKDTRVHGDLEFTGGCLIDGYVRGNVKSVKDDNATLNVSERGSIEGAVMVPNVLLNGTVKGDVKATQRVELGSKARVVGNVQYSLIEMAIGAEVNGKLIHESEASQREPADAEREPADVEQESAAAESPEEQSSADPAPVAQINVVGE